MIIICHDNVLIHRKCITNIPKNKNLFHSSHQFLKPFPELQRFPDFFDIVSSSIILPFVIFMERIWKKKFFHVCLRP